MAANRNRSFQVYQKKILLDLPFRVHLKKNPALKPVNSATVELQLEICKIPFKMLGATVARYESCAVDVLSLFVCEVPANALVSGQTSG